MDNAQIIDNFLHRFTQSVAQNTFVKLSLGNYKGADPELKNVYIKRVIIKKEEKLAFTYRYKTRDIAKNYALNEGMVLLKNALFNDFKAATLFTVEKDSVLDIRPDKTAKLREQAPTFTQAPTLAHDHHKNRPLLPDGKQYLTALKITDAKGAVLVNSQDKYKQINRYIELLSPYVKEIAPQSALKVVDMGSGKGYLTFALYDYLVNTLQQQATVTGVEVRPELVKLCNQIAEEAGFEALNFQEGTIDKYQSADFNVLIALHACDTATDDALAKGIKSGAELIVVAPCCHKQIRRELERNKPVNHLHFMTQYGIMLERHAEMLTDGIRALLLEYFGYKTKVFEFISDAHTPKNVMIVGVKQAVSAEKQAKMKDELQQLKQYFGIGFHYLEQALGI